MTTRENIGLLIVGVLGCTLILQRCNKPTTFKGPSQITNDGDTIVVKRKGKPDVKIFQPDPDSTVITTDKNGNVTVKVRQVGVGFDPGLGVGLSSRPRMALDARIAYFKRFGLNTGIGLSLDKNDYKTGRLLDIVAPYLGTSWVPFTRFANTSLVAAYALDKHVFVFIRVRL
jgi:hypothetical protein